MTAQSQTDLTTDINTNLATNGNRDITAAVLRTELKDIVDSYINNTSTSAQTINSDLEISGSLTVNGQPPILSQTILIDQGNTANQNPGATDTPLQIDFGVATSTTDVDVSAAGTITFNTTGTYNIHTHFRGGRSGAASTARILIAQELNGSYSFTQAACLIDNPDITCNVIDTDTYEFTAGDVLKYFIIRDSSGDNDGGLYGFNPVLAGVPDVYSAYLKITKLDY